MDLTNATIIAAMVMPFQESGEIDFDKLPQLVDYLLANHTEGAILAGTTGESPTLTHEEELQLFQRVIEPIGGRIPITYGVDTNDTCDLVAFVKELVTIAGIDAVLAVVPYYNKPDQEGMYQHLKTIAKANELPVILYNVPGRTAACLEVETTLCLAQLEEIVAIKECAGLDAATGLIERAPKDSLVYTGEDGLAFATKALGGQGAISVASHVFGSSMYEMYQALEQGNLPEAVKIQRQLLPKMNASLSVPSPVPAKTALNHLSIPVGNLRLPLAVCTPEEEQKIIRTLEI